MTDADLAEYENIAILFGVRSGDAIRSLIAEVRRLRSEAATTAQGEFELRAERNAYRSEWTDLGNQIVELRACLEFLVDALEQHYPVKQIPLVMKRCRAALDGGEK